MSIQNTNIFIYQMGKVASSSIRLTLSNLDNIDVIHGHYLNPKHSKYMNELKKELGWKKTPLNIEDVKKLQAKIVAEKHPKIITLVREPISRNISAFFQSLDKIVGIDDAHDKLSLEELVDTFFKQYPHHIPLTWFDNEFKEVLGIDIYKYPFPKDEGTMVINDGKHAILVLRYDLDDKLKSNYLQSFLCNGDIEIKNRNISALKPYAHIYKKFKQHISLPNNYIQEMLDSKYSQHFYSQQELEAIKNSWSK